MNTHTHDTLAVIQQVVCNVASETLSVPRDEVSPESRLIEDLRCDSLEIVEFVMELEAQFDVALPFEQQSPVYKSVFTRQPFRLRDLAELVYMQQGTGTPARSMWRSRPNDLPRSVVAPFSQLDGVWTPAPMSALLEPLTGTKGRWFRRKSDGMRCVLMPAAEAELGSNAATALADERPPHRAEIDAFLIDAEPVSTTAYCRFLNSVGEVPDDVLHDWFVLDPEDDRAEHAVVERTPQGWQPIRGTERFPMVLVSWFGANAYSLWANGQGWSGYADVDGISCLPSEAQWEYAARGGTHSEFPWGDAPATPERARFGRHVIGQEYRPETLPMATVNEELGMSPFGLHHMVGNVWQWCRDWYDEAFYGKPEARRRNPVCHSVTGVRSERGGSWVGPAELCRTSYRRGRAPSARGRCLGFRCITISTARYGAT